MALITFSDANRLFSLRRFPITWGLYSLYSGVYSTYTLTDVFIIRRVPAYIQSDNGSEFAAQAVRDWIKAVGAKTAYIEPGSPWENGYCDSLNARFRDELLNGKIFYSLKEAQIIIEQWRQHYNTKRPHSALRYIPPAPKTIVPIGRKVPMHLHSSWTKQWG